MSFDKANRRVDCIEALPMRKWIAQLCPLIALVAALSGCGGPATPEQPPEEYASSRQALSLCGQWDTYNVDPNKAYVVQQNEWGGNFGQCIDVNGTAFTVTSGNFNNSTSGAPATYPSIFKGCHWGNCTNSSGMPLQVSSLGSVTSSWSTSGASGAYDVAYDIWFNTTPTTSGQPNAAELMIWVNRGGNPQPAGSKVANVTAAGANWDVWFSTSFGWNYVAYLATSPVNAVSNLDIKALTNDAVARGYIKPAWYLIDIEAGFEIWSGGIGLKTSSFSASVVSGTNTGGGSSGGTSSGGTSTTSSPYSGSPVAVPGKIEAENFDNGGEGVAYHDSDATNSGGAYRSTGVDVESTTDSGGGYNVGWTAGGEWLAYTVNVPSAGTYTLQARVASNGSGGNFHVEFGGANKTGTMTVPNTGGWQSWTTLSATVSLSAGTQIMKIVEDSGGAGNGGNVGNFNWINVTSGSSTSSGSTGSTTTAPSVPTGLSATAGNAQVSLSWTASSGASSYNVLRSTTSGSGYASIASGVTTTSYTNTGLTNGTTYFYVVQAVNSTGTSGNSTQASATPMGTSSSLPSGCSSPITVPAGTSSVTLNSTAGGCYKVTIPSTTNNGNIAGWGCSSWDGRTMSVDGSAASSTCGYAITKWSDGSYYFNASAGTYAWAAFNWW